MHEWDESISFQEAAQKAFDLAHFIHDDPVISLDVAMKALAKRETNLSGTARVRYYLPKRFRTRVRLGEVQALQKLVYEESLTAEEEQEKQFMSLAHGTSYHPLSVDDWIIRFVKHLVGLSMGSSFDVTLGLGRMLFAYSPDQTLNMYEVIIQNPDRVKSAEYLKKRKNSWLMPQMKKRFGDLLQTSRFAHGEVRFVTRLNVIDFVPLVRQCLQFLTPWNSRCIPAEGFKNMHDIEELRFEGPDPNAEDAVEIRRMHTLIDPLCHERLAATLGLPGLAECLTLPSFRFERADNDNPPSKGPRRQAPRLTDHQIEQIGTYVDEQSRQRRKAKPDSLSIVVNRKERIVVTFEGSPVHMRLGDDARLMEIIDREVVLGVLLVDDRELARAMPSKEYSLLLSGGRKLTLNLSPIRNKDREFEGADVDIRFQKSGVLAKLGLGGNLQHDRRGAWVTTALASAIVLIVAGSLLGLFFWKRLAGSSESIAQLIPQSTPSLNATSKTQNNGPAPTATVPIRGNSNIKKLERHNTNSEGARAIPGEAARELAEIRRIYLEGGENSSDNTVPGVLAEAIVKSGRIQSVDPTNTDAYLRWKLTKAGSSIIIDARLTSTTGLLLWRISRVGRANDLSSVARKIADDLRVHLQP